MWTPSPEAVTDPPEWLAGIAATAHAVGGMVPVAGNRLVLLSENDDGFDPMIAAIDAAQDHVHVLFYIWLDDTSGRRVATALIAAARRGVACRVVVDAVGSRRFIRSDAWRQMEAAGVELAEAMPTGFSLLLSVLTRRLDLRNHRKIVLIDNLIGFTGSRNAADMAFAVKRRFAPWIDVWFAVEGPVLRQMQAVFLADWMSYTGHDLGESVLAAVPAAARPGVIGQVVATGPDRRAGSVSDCIIAMLAAARHEVIITTPLLRPQHRAGHGDSSLRAARGRGHADPAGTERFAVRGRDLGGVLSGSAARRRPADAVRTGAAARQAGHRRWRVAMLGSGNLDRRSFELNYEMNLIVVSEEATGEINARQHSYIARSRQLSLAEVEAWPSWRRIRNNMLALATPLL
jgi:cardiolipin synthase